MTAKLAWALSAIAAGAIFGFCAGGLLGARLLRGDLAGNLLLLLAGAALGALAGIVLGVVGALRWTRDKLWRACGAAVATTAAVVLATLALARVVGW